MKQFFLGFVSGLSVFIFFTLIVPGEGSASYKKGQIDALNGKVQFHLVVNPDSSRTWKRIEKEK